MKIRDGVELDEAGLAAFCAVHRIVRLAVYGSALRDDFSPQSDIDLLVEFEPGHTPGLLTQAGMELEFSKLVGGREIDLRTAEDLSPYFRDDVRAAARVLHHAA